MKELIAELKSKNIYLSVDKEELVIDFEGDDLSHDLISRIKDNKAALISYLGKYHNDGKYTEIPVLSSSNYYPISDAQRRLWVLSQFEGGSVAYNLPGSIYLNHEIEIESFKRAVDATIERHEILRTVFREDESGEIRQWVREREDLGFAIDYQDFRKEADRKEKAEAYIAADAYRPFDLARGPLLRAALLQVEEEEYVFYFNMHHIVSDGWSVSVLSKDVFKYYEAYKAGKEPQIKELRIQYRDYSAWQLTQLDQASFKAHKKYWVDKLSGELPLLDLPATRQRPKVRTYNGHTLATYLDKATTAKLKDYIQEKGGSLFMGLLASWNVLMYRYTSQKDIIIGTPVAGREHADLEDQIGFYVNTLVLRNEVNPEESFDRFYHALKGYTLKSYNHQMYPFDRLVEELDLQRDTSRNAVFDVMLTLQSNAAGIEEVEISEESLNQIVDQGFSTSKFDIEIRAQEIDAYLSLKIIFNPDVYEKTMVEGLIRHYRQLLSALLEAPEEKISTINYLSEDEKHKLLVTFNDTAVVYPRDKTIIDLFEEQVAMTPDNIAVVFEDTALTYRELNERSNQLAYYLRENYNIRPDDLVGIKQARSEWMIVSILGVLKSGGAYVPIDPEFPQERIAYIEVDTKSRVCLDEKELKAFKENQERYSKEPVSSAATSNNLAYVIYTSGSTGKPKGVMIEHQNVTNFFSGMTTIFGEEKGTFLSMTNFTFDISVLELLWTLSKGYKVVIQGDAMQISEEDKNNKTQYNYSVYSQVRKHKVTHLQITPSMGAMLNEHLSTDEGWGSIKNILLGGEPATVSLVNDIYQKLPGMQLYNMYGPTETTIWSTVKTLEKNTQRIEIGKPIANTKIYILDENRNPVAAGVQGEIYIGGEGVARGYTNKELTGLSFIESPFVAGDRLYRTGDFGSWLNNGSIYCSGRKDQQVKIRGYRIDLGEIEHALSNYKEIDQVVVLVKENQSGEKELVAYITSNSEQNINDLREYLKEKLPAYMLPAYFVQLEAMPLTVSGKVDKKSLPDPQGLGITSGVKYVGPRNELEEKLVKIWEQVLQRENIGMLDDFFVLGGHSLKAVRLSNEYQKELAVKLSLKELFVHTSVASHAALIASSAREAFVQIEKVTSQASYSISDGQRRLWVLSQFEGSSGAYNIPGSIYLDQDIDIENFKRAIDATINRHEILRTVFRGDESGEIRQWIVGKEDLGFAIDYQDFRKETNKKEKAEAYITADAYRAFDLAKGPLLRAALLQVEEKTFVFYFNMHHIISDGWSMEVLSKDVLKYYEAYKAGKAPE
ncbi:non-ribosomal peptide synthetase, partial [Niastella populi]|uniref:non-ribosomal peptide synthetase n=1 Tax=Niastella populi TaxID=550983 RepID=UPI0010554936